MIMKKLITIITCSLVSIATYSQDTNDRPVLVRGGNDYYYNPFGGSYTLLTNANLSIFITNNFGWEDLRFPASSAGKLNPSADVVDNSTDNGIDYKTSCDTNITDEHVYFIAQLPHAWRIGAAVHPHVHYRQTNADQTNMWYMYHRWKNIGGTNTSWTFTGPAVNKSSYTTGSMHQIADFPGISGAGKTESSIMDVKLMRDGNFGTGTVLLKEFDIHYEVQKPTGQLGVH